MAKADHDGHDPRTLALTMEVSTLLVTLETMMAGVSVGTVAVTGAVVVIATAAIVHNVVMCKRIVDAVVNAKKTKEGEKVGKDGTGEADKEIGDSENNPTDPSDMQRQVRKGKAPRGVDRVDKGNEGTCTQPHIHFKDGTSINQDGSIHDKRNGKPKLNNETKKWLDDNNWRY